MTQSLDFLGCLIQMSYSQWTTRERWSIGQIGVGSEGGQLGGGRVGLAWITQALHTLAQ